MPEQKLLDCEKASYKGLRGASRASGLEAASMVKSPVSAEEVEVPREEIEGLLASLIVPAKVLLH